MAKGKKGKKGGKKGKKKEEPDPNAITEVDRTFYELTIADLNRKLARLRDLTQELEIKNEELEKEKQKLDEDRADIIIFLKKTLQEKTDEISELEERVTALQETQHDEAEKYEQIIKDMNQDYKEMHEQLKSENKLLEGKLNALEEFRSTRDDLMRKFEKQENDMEAQEKRHKRELYEIERKFILKRDQLKKDMEAKIRQLSTNFHDATELRIAATTHRAIRENIAINNELDLVLTTQQHLYNENCDMKKRDTNLKQQCELHEVEKKQLLSKVKVQLKIIERLTDDHKFISDQLEKYKRFEEEVYQSRNEISELKEKMENVAFTSKVLEQNLHHVRCDRVTLQTELMYVKEENDKLNEVLLEAVDCIKDAMVMGSESDTSLLATRRENLLNILFTLLTKAKEQKLRRPSLETVDSIEATYAKGDLGFVPKPVELRSKVPVKKNMESQTATSFEEFLEFGRSAEVLKLTPSAVLAGLTSDRELRSEPKDDHSSVLFYDDRELVEEEQSAGSQDYLPQEEEEDESAAASPVTQTETTDAEKESPSATESPKPPSPSAAPAEGGATTTDAPPQEAVPAEGAEVPSPELAPTEGESPPPEAPKQDREAAQSPPPPEGSPPAEGSSAAEGLPATEGSSPSEQVEGGGENPDKLIKN